MEVTGSFFEVLKVERHCSLSAEAIRNEPVHEKINNLGFRPGLAKTRLDSHRSRLEA